MTTYSEFYNGLANLSVSGVAKKFSHPPLSLSSADLPAQWVALPNSDEEAMTFQANGGWTKFTADLIVAVNAVAQNMQPVNIADIINAMDNMRSALRGASLTKTELIWQMRVQIIPVAGIEYWCVLATVSGSG